MNSPEIDCTEVIPSSLEMLMNLNMTSSPFSQLCNYIVEGFKR